MMFHKRSIALLLVVSLLTIFMVGCANTGGGEKDSKGGEVKRFGLILGTSGLGDQSFNDLAYQGMTRAKDELDIEFDYVEPKAISDFEIQQREMADSEMYEVIIAVGFDQADALEKISAEYPDQKFAIIDSVVDAPNVASYVSEEHEGSFLIGAMAGLLKKEQSLENLNDTPTIGVIGAMSIDLINKFIAGYSAGAKYVYPEIEVLYDYAGDFNDPTTAKEIAIAMNGRGADIIYHAAGGSGLGLFQAAKENDFYAMGVNSNQNHIEPDYIIASMLKRIDIATFDLVKNAIEGSFQSGIVSLGTAQDGVGYSTENSNIVVPEDIINQVEEIREMIVRGELEIPATIEEVDGFLTNNQQNN